MYHSGVADKICKEKGDIPGATSNIEHLHADAYSGLREELSCNRVDQTRLNGEAFDLKGGMPEHIVIFTSHCRRCPQ